MSEWFALYVARLGVFETFWSVSGPRGSVCRDITSVNNRQYRLDETDLSAQSGGLHDFDFLI